MNMKYLLFTVIGIILGFSLRSQNVTGDLEGSVSFVTTQSVYVKFQSTENLKVGDTLYINQGGLLVPVLTVANLSSISCVCTPISSMGLKAGDAILSKAKIPLTLPAEQIESKQEIPPAIEEPIDTTSAAPKKVEQDVYGRVSVASYTNFSNAEADDSQRMRYTLSLNVKNIAKSKLSFESYLSFVHSNKNWDDVQENLFNGLKVYNLSLRYDFNETTSLAFGRKINPNLSSVGAIDGLQFEKKFRSISVGAFVGSRPDYNDYSYSFKLLQYGAFVGHNYQKEKKNMQTSVAFIQQMNDGNTDRRFLYFQHTNALLKKVYFFGSVEMDLYEQVKTIDPVTEVASYDPKGTFNLTNLYALLRYNISRKISLSFSYSARQNIIYYETYKDFIDRLLESQTLQGYRLMVNYRPVKNLSIGAKAGYRFRTNDPDPTQDFYGYATYSQVPFIKASATLSVTILETSYMTGNIYSLGLNRDLVPGKLSAGLNYRYIDYNFKNAEVPSVQNIGEIDLTWRIIKKLSFSVYYEGTFEKEITFNRIYANLGYRF